MMEWMPRRYGVITKGMSHILEYLFSRDYPFHIVLGGSCALSEFYLGHRTPQDIDIFFPNHLQQAQTAAAYLAEKFDSTSSPDPLADRTHNVFIVFGDEKVKVHCSSLHERWNNPGMTTNFAVQFEQFNVPTLPYLAFEKLRTLQDINVDSLKRGVSMYDMKCIFDTGISTDQIAGVASKCSAVMNLGNILCDLPVFVSIDGKTQYLSSFANEFTRAIQAAWIRNRLEEY